ncbi:MAG: TauD/TfdA family dioxygenase [Proteobacteria bacterium]|nr:TauD/TfdA family dioxygenase [Pseudomonadota bacterium]
MTDRSPEKGGANAQAHHQAALDAGFHSAWRPGNAAKPGEPIRGAAVWTGAELANRTDWMLRLNEADIAEIEAALRATQQGGIGIMDLTRENFQLPTVGPKLLAAQDDVINKRGFVLIKGVPRARYSDEECARIYWGIGRYFGDPVSQNGKGHLLGHVKDLSMDPKNPARRGYQTTERLLYHTDSCDIVGLFCLKKAKSGGFSSLVSAGAVHNALLDRRPDLVHLLYEPFYIDRKTEVPAGKLPWFQVSLLSYHDGGYVTSIYPRRDLESGQRFDEVPKLTDAQWQLLKLMESIAEELSLKMMIEEGDIQFLQNHVCYHSRTAFEDWPDWNKKRHMLRLWLSAPNGRPLPQCFAERYGPIAVGSVRGGIVVPGMSLSAPIDAV